MPAASGSSSVAEKMRKSLSPDRDRAPRAAASKDRASTGSQRRSCSGGSGATTASKVSSAGGSPGTKGACCWASAGKALLGPLKAADGAKAEAMKDTLTFDALFKQYELAKAFSLDTSTVRHDAKRIKKRLRDSNRMLINPEGRAMQVWDLVTIIALLFTLLATPFEIGFLDDFDGPGTTATPSAGPLPYAPVRSL
jgi:hypothetical protein